MDPAVSVKMDSDIIRDLRMLDREGMAPLRQPPLALTAHLVTVVVRQSVVEWVLMPWRAGPAAVALGIFIFQHAMQILRSFSFRTDKFA